MSPGEKLAISEGFSGELERRKRLGQYFTGIHLGRLLAALADVTSETFVLDPMSGTGDLLAACTELGVSTHRMGAIEIDPIAIDTCKQRLPGASAIQGNAFDPKVLNKLPRLQWDIVIANPPYVRYQSTSKGRGKYFALPSAADVRSGLLKEIALLPALDEVDKALFERLIQGYSGFADLAVPAWILSAALVTPGGRLALVVPESWLSRDYASVVHYMLLRWFDIEFVVEDEHATWFADAQIKTTLLIARRVARRDKVFDAQNVKSYLRIAVSGRASNESGPCSGLYDGEQEPERRFAKRARDWLISGLGHRDELLRAYHVPLTGMASNLQGTVAKQRWLSLVEPTIQEVGPVIPHEIQTWLDQAESTTRLVSLESLGVNVGQGLRTGANSFFYADAHDGGNLGLEKLLPGLTFDAPEDIPIPAIRKQSDLPAGYSVHPGLTSGRVLDLRRYALPEDIRSLSKRFASAYTSMPRALARVVRQVSSRQFGDGPDAKHIWELSAVKPNIRRANPKQNLAPRFWYMLPDFSQRHRPDILVPRVNSGSPKAWLNAGRGCIVDANFATLWTDGERIGAYALLALLNSAWTMAALEYSASVMGGGALKLEAAHLKRLPVPYLDAESRAELDRLGKGLADPRGGTERLLGEIDIVIASAALGRPSEDVTVTALRELAAEGRLKRDKHKNRGM